MSKPSGNALPPMIGLVLAALLAGYYFLTGQQNEPSPPPEAQGQFDPSEGVLKLQFLDVGQGDAVLVTSPEGKTLLYDGGRSTTRMREHIKNLGLQKLDIMVASHGDFDHINGLNEAVKLQPQYFINNGIAADTQAYRKLIAALRKAKTQGIEATDRTINLGTVPLRILDIPKGLGKDDQNANSVGLLIQRGSFEAFLGGDSEKDTMEGWMNQYGKVLNDIDVYKSAHHGSPHNDNAGFLNLLKPEVVVIGVGPNNYGHPAQEALDLYEQHARDTYRTDLNGTVTIEVDSAGRYRVLAEKGSPQ